MAQKKSLDVELGSETVFEDLGFEAEEAMNLKIRADLMLDLRDSPTERLCHRIQKQGWTQKEAAEFLGETQPRISNIKSSYRIRT